MKFVRPLAFTLTVLLGCVALQAQTSPTPATGATPPALKAIAAKNAPVAWINSAAFLDEATGIKQLVRVNKELDLEFSGQQGDLGLLQEKLRTLVTELQTLRAGGEANAEAIKIKQEAGVKLNQELQTKGQQFQAALQQAQQQKQGPVAADLTQAVADFTKAHNIGILIDIAKMGDAVLAAKPELDVTADFIAYYNASHP